jgi:hypothetical protein
VTGVAADEVAADGGDRRLGRRLLQYVRPYRLAVAGAVALLLL